MSKATDLKIKIKIQKLKLLQILFTDIIYTDITSEPLDYLDYPIYSYIDKTKRTYIYLTAHSYIDRRLPVSKSDMIYINSIIRTLIKILGTDISKLNKLYIHSKLYIKTPSNNFIHYSPTDEWLLAYKQLLSILK